MEEAIFSPGASSEVCGEMSANDDSASLLVVELTLTAVDTQAGKLIAFVAPAFPADTIVGIPTERRLSMISLMGSPSQDDDEVGPPLTWRLAAAKA